MSFSCSDCMTRDSKTFRCTFCTYKLYSCCFCTAPVGLISYTLNCACLFFSLSVFLRASSWRSSSLPKWWAWMSFWWQIWTLCKIFSSYPTDGALGLTPKSSRFNPRPWLSTGTSLRQPSGLVCVLHFWFRIEIKLFPLTGSMKCVKIQKMWLMITNSLLKYL